MHLSRRGIPFVTLILYFVLFTSVQESPSIFGFVSAIVVHGGSALAMAGKDSVALAIDERIGTTASMIDTIPDDSISSMNKDKENIFQRVLQVDNFCLVSGIGCESHAQTLLEDLKMELSIKEFQQSKFASFAGTIRRKKNNVNMISHLVSNILYNSKRLQVCPVIVGLDEIILRKKGEGEIAYKPQICCQDSIGAYTFSDNFAAIGSSRSSLLGACETLYRRDMNVNELKDCAASCMESSLDRDCQGGYGFRLYILSKEGVNCWKYQGRMD